MQLTKEMANNFQVLQGGASLTFTDAQISSSFSDSKLILRGISGQFRSGHLNAILGPSGAGKSTLLNFLAGYKTLGATGSIMVNGKPRNLKQFRKLSRYIMQDDILQSKLTVLESMAIAADLKLRNELSEEDRRIAISEILELLRLTAAKDTLVDLLSGGERKRLSISLELLSNPLVIFLDEPTTGLDDSASFLTISLLKQLADGGRTVIFSVHAPSARLFEEFDHTYVMSAGLCMFQGCGQNIIPFMSKIGLPCPLYHNPADFIIEACHGDYDGKFIEKMSAITDNGKNICCNSESGLQFKNITSNKLTSAEKISAIDCSLTGPMDLQLHADIYNYSVWYQFKILLCRCWMQTVKEKKALVVKAIICAAVGVLHGSLYFKVGQDASKALSNFSYCYTVTVGLLFGVMLSALVYFPMEIKLIRREYFNQWYGLTAYYLATSVKTLLHHSALLSTPTIISYVMSDQPIEFHRMMLFFLIMMLIIFTTDSLGLMISSHLSLINGMFIGCVVLVPLILLGVYGQGQGYSTIPIIIRIGMHCSYIRYGIEGLTVALYGNDRALLTCPDEVDVCIFRDPKFLLSFLGTGNIPIWVDLVVLFTFFFVFRIISLYLIRQRLRPNKIFVTLKVMSRAARYRFSLMR